MTEKKRSSPDEQLGMIATKQWELYRRVKEGTLDTRSVLNKLQMIISGGRNIYYHKCKWEEFYKEEFGQVIDFIDIPVPEAGDEYSWFYMNHPKITFGDLLIGGKNPPKCGASVQKFTNADIDWSFGRDSKAQEEPYIVRCRPLIEADEDMKKKNASDIHDMGINTMTLKERVGLGRFLFWSDGIVLDKVMFGLSDDKMITLCSGSRYAKGDDVPSVSWGESGVSLDWYRFWDVDFAYVRARRVVS